MQKVLVAVVITAALQTAHAQSQDGKATLNAALGALGAKTLTSLQFTARGSNHAFGQAWRPDTPWPAFKLINYTATIDYATPAMRIDLERTNPDVSPIRGGGGLPLLAPQQQIQAVSGKLAWNLVVSPNGGLVATPAPAAVSDRLLALWTLTPQGVIKAAIANNATAAARIVSFKIGATPVKATLGPTNLVQKVEVRGDTPVLGDTVTETTFAEYSDYHGVQFPTHIVQKQGGFPILDLTVTAVRPQSNVPIDVPAAVQQAPGQAPPAAVRVDSQKLADGVYYLTGGSHHSVAVEFKDYVVVIEAPQTDERAVAVLESVKKTMPNKPIRYVVNSHNHFDHLGGVRAAMAEGSTIVTQASNKLYYERIAAMPHTISPDRLAQAPKRPVIEGVADKRVFSDDTQTLELYRLSTDHCDTMLVGYLPKAKILIEADLWNPPAANAPPPAAVNPVTVQLVDGIKRLNLDVQQIAGLHGRAATFKELQAAVTSPPRS